MTERKQLTEGKRDMLAVLRGRGIGVREIGVPIGYSFYFDSDFI